MFTLDLNYLENNTAKVSRPNADVWLAVIREQWKLLMTAQAMS